MKKLIQFTIALAVFSLVLSASAQLVPDPVTLDARAATFRDTDIQEDQSKIPDQSNREGYLAYVFDVARDGGSGAIKVGPVLPDNTAIVDGFVQVTTAFTPANATNTVAFSVEGANDLLAATQMTAGLHMLNRASASYIIAAGTATNTVVSLKAPVVTTTATRQLTLTFAGAPATNGTAYIWLKLVQAQ